MGVMLGDGLTVDPALNLSDVTASVITGTGTDRVTVAWSSPSAAANCIWVGVRPPGVSEYNASGDFRLAPDARSFEPTPVGQAGTWCYQFVAIKDSARSEGSELCVEVANPQPLAPTPGPTRSTDAPAPPNTGSGQHGGTPWMIAFGVLLVGTAGVLAISGSGLSGKR
ncbi:MAG: hypothetical protein ACM3S1_13150 [Hyphomicrobiales bacterium]